MNITIHNSKNNNTIFNTKNWIEYTKEIREVLEKQQSKKVSIWPYPSCPNCGSVEVQAGAEMIELDYCQDCGQKLDWSEVE